MQKLFSMFPRGAPGLGLLLLRLFVGAALILDALMGISMRSGILVAVLVASALALAVGALTPIAAVLAALCETVWLTAFDAPIVLHSFAPIAIAIALALLGPGAYSVDARMFGRRQMEFGPRMNDDG